MTARPLDLVLAVRDLCRPCLAGWRVRPAGTRHTAMIPLRDGDAWERQMTDIPDRGLRPISGGRDAADQDPESDPVTGRMTTGHEWDGIRELNTPLPKWWVYTFFATIVFAIGYCVLYPSVPASRPHEGPARLQHADGAEPADRDGNEAQRASALARIRTPRLTRSGGIPSCWPLRRPAARRPSRKLRRPATGPAAPALQGFPALADDEWLWGGKLDRYPADHRSWNAQRQRDAAIRRCRASADGMLTPRRSCGRRLRAVPVRPPQADARTAKGPRSSRRTAPPATARRRGQPGDGRARLADGMWLYGGDRAAIVRRSRYARNGSMPAWGERLDPATIKMLTLYVHALGGGK